MNTNMTRFRWFPKIFAFLCFGRKQLQNWKGKGMIRSRKIYLAHPCQHFPCPMIHNSCGCQLFFLILPTDMIYFIHIITFITAASNLFRSLTGKGNHYTGELGYDGPLYDGFLHMTDDMLGPSPMQIKYSSYVYDGFCI